MVSLEAELWMGRHTPPLLAAVIGNGDRLGLCLGVLAAPPALTLRWMHPDSASWPSAESSRKIRAGWTCQLVDSVNPARKAQRNNSNATTSTVRCL